MLKTLAFFHKSVVAATTLTCVLITIFDFGTFLHGAHALFELPVGAKGV